MRQNKLFQFYITNMCNSYCRTCSIWKNQEREEIQTSDIKSVIKAYPKADYVIGGGEAILHKDIEGILRTLSDHMINYTLLSNCIELEALKRLVDIYQVNNITISYDGLNHDRIRRYKGNHKNIIEFIEWCKNKDKNVKLSYTYSKYNEDNFTEDMDYIRKVLHINEIYLCIANNLELLKVDTSNSPCPKDIKPILQRQGMLSTKDIRHICSMVVSPRRKCNSQSSVHTIYSNGDIVRCQAYLSNDIIGNIKNKTPEEIRNIFDNIKDIPCKYDKQCNQLCQRRYDTIE